MASLYSGPFRAFRIADSRFPIFDGTGAYLKGGRWTSEGRRVINAAESYAGALLEILIHSNLGRSSSAHVWIEIGAPSGTSIEAVGIHEVAGWDAPDLVASREYGDRWYRERRTVVLLVPSVVTRGIERNVLINQEHPGFASITATEARGVNWDERLFRR